VDAGTKKSEAVSAASTRWLTTQKASKRSSYPLVNIVVLTLCAVPSGTDDFVSIAHWDNTNRRWLLKFLDMSQGASWHDRFNAILEALMPAEFVKSLWSWITALHEVTNGHRRPRAPG
jgi:hypothetical protein